MGGGGSKQTPTGVVPGGGRSGGGSAGGGDGGGPDAYSGGVRQNAASTLEEFEMDDEVAQQTADLLFDLLPYYGTGNAEADQIFLATLQANDILAHSRDAHGNTLLMIACQASKQDIINLMIEKEVDVNAQNYMGVTALHIVCYDATSESYSMCERLIQAGAGIDAADAEGCTPLHYAASGGHASLVALLLMYGAEAGRQDAMGYTAQDYAVQSNHMEVVQLLFHTGSEDKSGQDKANDGTSTGTAGEAKATAGEDELAKASEELWQEYIDPASGCPYYYNMLTGETTWERPASFKPATVVSAIASAAAEAKKKKIDEKIQDSRADGELGAAFLLERWRRVAWREGMRRVVANQKKAQRKFALAQAKARAYLLQQGGEASDAAVKQMNISKKEAAELKAKLASNNGQYCESLSGFANVSHMRFYNSRCRFAVIALFLFTLVHHPLMLLPSFFSLSLSHGTLLPQSIDAFVISRKLCWLPRNGGAQAAACREGQGAGRYGQADGAHGRITDARPEGPVRVGKSSCTRRNGGAPCCQAQRARRSCAGQRGRDGQHAGQIGSRRGRCRVPEEGAVAAGATGRHCRGAQGGGADCRDESPARS